MNGDDTESLLKPFGGIAPSPPTWSQVSPDQQSLRQKIDALGATPLPPPPDAIHEGVAHDPDGPIRDVKITHYGYEAPHTKNWDPNSAKGIGDRNNMLTYDPEGITSAALTPNYRLTRFGTKGASTGIVFQVGDRLFRDDDTTSKKLTDNRIDIYDPNNDGTGFPGTMQVSDSAHYTANMPVPPVNVPVAMASRGTFAPLPPE